MKKGTFYLFIAFILFLVPAAVSFAQAPDVDIDSLQVRFWPDFDKPSVLVLINGQLPEETILPIEVTIPLPQDAEINAVAHISDTEMLNLEFESADGFVTFLTPSPSFLVEYYAPYQQEGSTRSYDFEWQSNLSVGQLVAEVQQPVNASSLSTEPAATNVYNGQVDGLIYHGLEPQTVTAGTPYQLRFDYVMNSDELTVGPISEPPPATSGPAPAVVEEGDNNWLLFAGIAGLVALAVVSTWMVATRSSGRKSSKPIKPMPKTRSSAKKSKLVYCHNCGQGAEGNDRFCRRCGTELKRS